MDWKPIGTYTAAYTGTFNGNGYTISGLKISTAYNQGLFGYTVNAVLANVTIKNPVISVTSSSSSNTGTLVGFANTNTTITRCAVEGGKVTGSGRVGGLVGTANGTHIAGCYTAGTQVTGYSAVGGLVGYTNGGTIAACYATATVTANFADGGLVGSNTGSTTIAFCYTTEDKLVGDDSGTTVSCYDGSATPNLTTLQGYATEVPVDIWTASTGKKQIPLTGTIWKTLTTFNLEQLK
ncbi:hypothetical protein LJC05_01785 [Bacteroides sp. OttesenSCG-928-J23]|nr:hypothetical protein [Bacteroides sp. OttesenSCG-928-N06]MDL2247444.1 hypothetical protein [Bacteroides sp. OttesenSCG-928-J23]MDL2304745.1 hypothetical protein [Bacteroides sp. OttesenSCG-928-D19]